MGVSGPFFSGLGFGVGFQGISEFRLEGAFLEWVGGGGGYVRETEDEGLGARLHSATTICLGASPKKHNRQSSLYYPYKEAQLLLLWGVLKASSTIVGAGTRKDPLETYGRGS